MELHLIIILIFRKATVKQKCHTARLVTGQRQYRGFFSLMFMFFPLHLHYLSKCWYQKNPYVPIQLYRHVSKPLPSFYCFWHFIINFYNPFIIHISKSYFGGETVDMESWTHKSNFSVLIPSVECYDHHIRHFGRVCILNLTAALVFQKYW